MKGAHMLTAILVLKDIIIPLAFIICGVLR
jgi:hypothetical protein